jgi:hypothetical protein
VNFKYLIDFINYYDSERCCISSILERDLRRRREKLSAYPKFGRGGSRKKGRV